MNHEELSYEKMFKKINRYLSMSGSSVDKNDVRRNVMKRFRFRRYYCFNLALIASHLIGEVIWGIQGIRTKSASLSQLTFLIPGITLCCVGFLKSFFFIKNGDLVNDLIMTIKKLQSQSAETKRNAELEIETKKRIMIMTSIQNFNTFLYIFGMALFAIDPLFVTWLKYKATGVIVMQLPFLSYFPFDETDLRFWPIAYFHQLWTSVVTISTVHGPDCFYSYSCTFLLIRFKTLQYDIQRICPDNENLTEMETKQIFRERFHEIMLRHKELIRCVNIIENVFSKSTLGNLAVSAMVMCVCAFNVTILDDIVIIAPFVCFLVIWVLQVFVLCYFSDLLIESSSEVSNAVYRSSWYNSNVAIRKDLLFVLTRAQKPCKLTAAGFTDLNLRVFCKICSSAWSYFALLQTVYGKK